MIKSNLYNFSGLLLIIHATYFVNKGFRNAAKKHNQSLQTQKNKAVYYMITEPWKTKFYWGGVTQLLLLFIIILLQIID